MFSIGYGYRIFHSLGIPTFAKLIASNKIIKKACVFCVICVHYIIYTTKGDACVCVFAKLDQFLPVRSQFDSNQRENSVRIATFQSANFGPLFLRSIVLCFFTKTK